MLFKLSPFDPEQFVHEAMKVEGPVGNYYRQQIPAYAVAAVAEVMSALSLPGMHRWFISTGGRLVESKSGSTFLLMCFTGSYDLVEMNGHNEFEIWGTPMRYQDREKHAYNLDQMQFYITRFQMALYTGWVERGGFARGNKFLSPAHLIPLEYPAAS